VDWPAGLGQAVAMIPPLTDAERTRLRAFMARPGGPSYERASGILHALATAPTRVDPSAWLAELIGERELDSPDDVLLIRRLRDRVLVAFEEGALEVPEDAAAIRAFCEGYVHVAMADRAWRANEKATLEAFPLLCLAQGKRPSELGVDGVADEEGWLAEQRRDLEQTVLAVHAALAADRDAAVTPVRREKVGRNEPCPCGSGRKYKKCCLRL
jgi:uncharacterized protein YecA (UPF0149 family)